MVKMILGGDRADTLSQSRLSYDLSNFRAIDSILKDSFGGLQVSHATLQ